MFHGPGQPHRPAQRGSRARAPLDRPVHQSHRHGEGRGIPSTATAPGSSSAGAREALAADLELESAQLERYRERVAQAEELGLPDVAEVLAPLLEQTQEHARDLRAALG